MFGKTEVCTYSELESVGYFVPPCLCTYGQTSQNLEKKFLLGKWPIRSEQAGRGATVNRFEEAEVVVALICDRFLAK